MQISSCNLFNWDRDTNKQECIPVGCLPPTHWPHLVVSGGVCVGGTCMAEGCMAGGSCMAWWWMTGGVHGSGACMVGRGCVAYTPPMDRILDTRLWKHYLPATSLWAVIDKQNYLSPTQGKVCSSTSLCCVSNLLPFVAHFISPDSIKSRTTD